jgi:hypothetical protein
MLPGFRFLLSAIVLCFSILVFGLGAAALLRAAHEQFASRPSWYPTPSTTFAQESDPLARQRDSGSVLALLEVDPDDNDAPQKTPHDTPHESPHDTPREPGLQPPASEPTAAVTDPASGNLPDAPELAAPSAPEQPSPTAAGETAGNPPTPDLDKPAQMEAETSLGEGSAAVERAAPTVASEPETRIASVDETTSKAVVEPSTAASEPINVPAVAAEPTAPPIAAPQIAALGGSLEAADAQAREKEATNDARAKSYRNFIRNRLRAQRAAKARRHLAHRATRPVRRAAIQQQRPAAFATVPAATAAPATENPYRF